MFSSGNRIINGEEATPHDYPWLVALFADNWFCSASLIAPNWVLTAAHCVDGASHWRVYLGSHDLDDNSEVGREIIESYNGFTHPDWDYSSLRNDLALIKLPQDATLNSNPRIQ